MIFRQITHTFESYIRSFPVVVLTGARQVGKTTFLKSVLSREYQYVLLEDPDLKNFARSDPRAFLEKYSNKVIFDEVQEVPELVSYLQGQVDNNRKSKGQFILTGSQNFTLMEQVTQSLAGRAGILELFPLATNEIKIKNSNNKDALLAACLRGFYPELWEESERDTRSWFASYIKTYLERDIRALSQVGDLSGFDRFMRVLGARMGQLLNVSEVARDSGVSPSTAERWISILEATYIIFRLEPYHVNISTRVRKATKLYFFDVGLGLYLAGFRNLESLVAAPQVGAVFENFVIADLKKRLAHLGQDQMLYYLNLPKIAEVDLILEKESEIHLAEIKFSKTPGVGQGNSLEKISNYLKKPIKSKSVIGLFEGEHRALGIDYLSWSQFAEKIVK